MKKLALLLLIIAASRFAVHAADKDSITQKTPAETIVIDTLRQQLKDAANDSLKAGIYTQLASQYLSYDTIADKQIKLHYQEQALAYTYLALHGYSRYNDTLGLRTCFDYLTKVYRSQKKYSQAKWFILQSNSLSRLKNDVPNIILSLNQLAGIKIDIKDYSLAKRDLDEALHLSSVNHRAQDQANVQQNFVLLYSLMKQYDKEAIALKRYKYLEDSIKKADRYQLMASLNRRDSIARAKKKFSLISYRQSSKTNSGRRLAAI